MSRLFPACKKNDRYNNVEGQIQATTRVRKPPREEEPSENLSAKSGSSHDEEVLIPGSPYAGALCAAPGNPTVPGMVASNMMGQSWSPYGLYTCIL